MTTARIALVTGGAGAIGSAVVRDLVADGFRVVAVDRSPETPQVARDLGAELGLVVDLSDPEAIDALVEQVQDQLGTVSALINNAGFDRVQPFLSTTPEFWEEIVAINLMSHIRLTHRLLPGMRDQGWGRVVFVSSEAGRFGSKGQAIYAACKSGQLGFMRSIAREMAKHDILCNAVSPGPVDSQLLHAVTDDAPQLLTAMERSIPLGRVATADDVSGVVAFLCGDRASYVTGQTISVSGGQSMA